MPPKSSRSKASKTGGKDALPPMTALTTDQLIARRWTDDLPETADYYYDSKVKDVSRKLKEYPPENLDLSDAWIVALVNSKLTREERGAGWPTVFTNRGALRAHYVHKGQTTKLYDPETNEIRYALLFGEHNMIETEGMREGLPTRRPTILSEADPVTHGLLAQVQDLAYNDTKASEDAKAARPVATKKIVTARTTGFTAINRQGASDVKESEEGSEKDEAAEKPVTRYSKRLMKKDANESGPSQPNKKQKITIGRSFKPTDEATVPAHPSMSDSWAAQTPSASTAKPHHGKLRVKTSSYEGASSEISLRTLCL